MNVRYYVDSVFKRKKHVKCEAAIQFIGNNNDGSEPFGTFCDLRIGDKVLTRSQIRQYSCYAPEITDIQPDVLVLKMCEAVPYFAKAFNNCIAPTLISILKFFGNLASNSKYY